MATPTHLQQQIKETKKEYDLLSRLIFDIKKDRVIATDPSDRFKFDEQIKRLEANREQLDQKIDRLEKQLYAASELKMTARINQEVQEAPKLEEAEISEDAIIVEEPPDPPPDTKKMKASEHSRVAWIVSLNYDIVCIMIR